jgi:rhamnosyltransferase
VHGNNHLTTGPNQSNDESRVTVGTVNSASVLAVNEQPILVYAAIVTYYPDLNQLDRLLTAVIPQVSCVAIIDNTPTRPVVAWQSERSVHRDVCVFSEGKNTGIGAGHNRGIEWSMAGAATHILLLDQDSVPHPDMVQTLLSAWCNLKSRGLTVSAVGPQFLDSRSRTPSYFVRYGGLGKERIICNGTNKGKLIRCDFLISSGSLIPLQVIKAVGRMDASLFIDHVDTEWFLRARAKGYSAFGVCQAYMHHALGDDRHRFWAGRSYAVARYRPIRYYYIFRNSVLLYGRGYVPLFWKVSDFGRLLGLFLIHGIFDAARAKNVRMMFKGIIHGLRGRTGALLLE